MCRLRGLLLPDRPLWHTKEHSKIVPDPLRCKPTVLGESHLTSTYIYVNGLQSQLRLFRSWSPCLKTTTDCMSERSTIAYLNSSSDSSRPSIGQVQDAAGDLEPLVESACMYRQGVAPAHPGRTPATRWIIWSADDNLAGYRSRAFFRRPYKSEPVHGGLRLID